MRKKLYFLFFVIIAVLMGVRDVYADGDCYFHLIVNSSNTGITGVNPLGIFISPDGDYDDSAQGLTTVLSSDGQQRMDYLYNARAEVLGEGNFFNLLQSSGATPQFQVTCGATYTLNLYSTAGGECSFPANIDPNTPTNQLWKAEMIHHCNGELVQDATIPVSAVNFLFTNTTNHVMLLHLPEVSQTSGDTSEMNYVLSPGQTQTLTLDASDNETAEIASIGGVQFFISPDSTVQDFDSDLKSNMIPGVSISTNNTTQKLPNTLGITQILGGSYPLKSAVTCEVPSQPPQGGSDTSDPTVMAELSACNPSPIFVWEVGSANVVGPCNSSDPDPQSGFCWYRSQDDSSQGNFDLQIQDPKSV